MHHGSVSKEIREANETMMRDARPCSILCSSTLELGIDVGNVERVGQIGTPWSVSSMIQRLGRSGRRSGTVSDMRAFIPDFECTHESSLIDRLHLDLVRMIALISLMNEKWVEPPELHGHDLSTLTQQILSFIKQGGGATAGQLYEVLIQKGVFSSVAQETFIKLLRCLGAKELLHQVPTGELVLGTVGEKITSRFEFYSEFTTTTDYRVVHKARMIGTLPTDSAINIGERFLLAGRRWEVVDVDPDRQQISVIPTNVPKWTKFAGSGGEVHPRVRQMMLQVLLDDEMPAYLNPIGSKWLDDGRKTAKEANLLKDRWWSLGPQKSLLFTWTGSRIHATLLAIQAAAILN